MAKIWLEILTPKQFWYFRKVGQLLKKRGHKIVYTLRRYEQLDPFTGELQGDEFYVVGEFGGADIREKLKKSVERTALLLQILDEFDCAVSSGSPEAARIAYGLSVPHVLASDTPESPVNRLAAPVSAKVATPWIIGKRPWTRYGVRDSDVVLYRGLDPVAWVKDYTPDKSFLKKLGLEEKSYVLVRSPEYKASYLRGTPWSLEDYAKFVETLTEKTGHRTVVLPRYVDEAQALKTKLKDRALVVENPVTNHHLLYFSTLLIGGGGTMTQEAALFGIPAVSIYPGKPPLVIRYLINQKLVKMLKEPEQVLDKINKIIEDASKNQERYRERAAKMVEKMEDPAEKVVAAVEAVTTG
ncbi:MAG: DUF354 domain-containing protein [Candidatus Caldarchaeum sp.]|nr:DUF354 domain-containing protein [Candidatus Caldarchaeum sp.]MDW8436257.1 DUF354 domain-containing protein [Candidatus Caldarchaeum sp.]